MPERLLELYQGLKKVIQRARPTEVAIEKVFVGASAQSALKLGQARGVAILASAEYNLAVLEYSPNQIKKAVVGRGHADKTQVMFMIKVILSLSEVPESDAADALAIAIAASNDAGKPAGIALRLAQSVPDDPLSKAISLALARDDAKHRDKT